MNMNIFMLLPFLSLFMNKALFVRCPVVCPWPGEVLKVAFYRKLCLQKRSRVLPHMPPRALASALATVLEDWDIFTVGDFADFMDGIDGIVY